MNRVALINMPFASLGRPSIGLALLQGGLNRASIDADTFYFNLSFAKTIGASVFNWIAEMSPTTALLGDWLFSHAAFCEDAEPGAAYVDAILHRRFSEAFTPALLDAILGVRSQINNFLDDCVASVPWSRYAVVGFTSMFQQNTATIALARRIKKLGQNQCIVLGGPNCEGEMGETLLENLPFIDAVCSGEGDASFVTFVTRTLRGESVTDLDGISVRKDGQVIARSHSSRPILDMDALPHPDYSEYFAQLEATIGRESVSISIPFETSRGCWWGAKQHCTFCGLNGITMTYRSKSPERAVTEVLELAGQFGRELLCVDNIFDLRYLGTFFPQLADQNAGLSLFFESKVNLKREHIQLLRQAGVRLLQPGIESLSSSILRLMRKGCSLLQVLQTLKWCRTEGIGVVWNLLFGFPGEDADEYAGMASLIPSLYHLTPPMGAYPIRLDRFSPYFEHPESFGITSIRPQEAYSHVYPFNGDVLRRIAYYFEFTHPAFHTGLSYCAPVVDAVSAWQKAHTESALEAHIESGALEITDCRSQDSVFRYRLLGSDRMVYEFCDETRHFDTIARHLSTSGSNVVMSEGELTSLLAEFVNERLMVREGERFLSLATGLPAKSGAMLTAETSGQLAVEELGT